MKTLAPAKINLSLNVVGKRKDGYHELDMINATVSLFDTLIIKLTKSPQIIIKCKNKELSNKSNLICRAIDAFKKAYPFDNGVKVNLIKRIPVGAGLGGGSSDAAATIIALNKLLKLKLSEIELIDIAKNVGADVPYLINKKIARVRGMGEEIKELKNQLNLKCIIVKPQKGINTKDCFNNLNLKKIYHPDIEKLEEKIMSNEVHQLPFYLGNSLAESAHQLEPIILEIEKKLKYFEFSGVVMSGSGSAVIGFLPHNDNFKDAKNYFQKKGYFVKVVEIN